MDLSIHHSSTLLYTAPITNEPVKLREVKILHGRLLHIIICVLNIAYEKEVGARLLYRNLSGKGIMAHLKASYVGSEKNVDEKQPNIDIFEVKYDMTKNRSNRAPWSPVVNLVPYYRVKGEYYEDNPNDREETYRVAEDCIVRIICKKGYVFKAPIVSKFESDLAWEIFEKEAGLDKTNEAKKNLMRHNSESGDFISKDNKVFWEVNFKDALLQCSGNNQRAWKYFCHKTSCIPDSSLESKKIHKTQNALDDYDYCDDVKSWKNRLNEDTTSKSSSWKIPGCEEFYKQDMFQNPFAYVKELKEDNDDSTNKSKSNKSNSNMKSTPVSSKHLNKTKNNEYQNINNPKTISNKINNKTAKMMN